MKKEEPQVTHEIVEAEITAVSLVKRGANRSPFKIIKADGSFQLDAVFKKSAGADKQLVYGEVYAPLTPDSHGDYMSAELIERMAYQFITSGRVDQIDTEHNLIPNGSSVVESFIARKGDPDFTPGAWVLGVHVSDAALWQQIKAGEITGFSMYGTGERVERPIQKSADPYKIDDSRPDNGEAAGAAADARYPLGRPREDLSWLVRKQDLDSLERDATRRVAAAKAFQ